MENIKDLSDGTMEGDESDLFTIYLATAPCIDLVKVGIWSGNHSRLFSRYFTYYGEELILYMFTSNVSQYHLELAFKRHFIDKCHSSELFEKQFINEYIKFLSKHTNMTPVVKERTFHENKNKLPMCLRNNNLLCSSTLSLKYKVENLIPTLCEKLGLKDHYDTTTIVPDDALRNIHQDTKLQNQLDEVLAELPPTYYRGRVQDRKKEQNVRVISGIFQWWNRHSFNVVNMQRTRCGNRNKKTLHDCKLFSCDGVEQI